MVSLRKTAAVRYPSTQCTYRADSPETAGQRVRILYLCESVESVVRIGIEMLVVKRLVVGWVGTNCYVLGDGREGAVVDPGAEPERILREVSELGVQVRYIINTHGHIDHLGANKGVKEATGAEILIHREDEPILRAPQKDLFPILSDLPDSPPPDRFLEEGEAIRIGETSLTVLHTPGHSPGGISLIYEQGVFSGDTLFYDSIGRTDLAGGSYEVLMESIRKKLLPLSGEMLVYPGHGPMATLEEIRRVNPFINYQ